MTLMERVERAGNAPIYRFEESEQSSLARLRAEVQEIVSVDKIAQLARENPEQARSEVRSASRRVFERPSWAWASDRVRARLVERLLDTTFGYGLLEGLIADPTITEVMVNGTRSLFYERGGVIHESEYRYDDESELRALIDRILGPLGRRVDEASPMVNARLDQGHRVHVVIPPISLIGPVVTIRKFSEHVITLDDMLATGTIDEQLRTILIWSVHARRSIAVSGGTGSGKTTLLNALSCVISPDERIVTIEDSAELRFFEHPHVVGLEARPKNAEGTGEVTIRDLVINALRMRPDRIIVGECRGAEALDMLQAMNTGHDGSLTTLHANSPEESIGRLETMVRYGADLPIDVIEANIASAIDLIVQMRRDPDGSRVVSKIVELEFDRDRGRCTAVAVYERPLGAVEGTWLHIPAWVDRMESEQRATGEEVRLWKQRCLRVA